MFAGDPAGGLNMSGLRPEYQKVLDVACKRYLSEPGLTHYNLMELVAERCQDLADKPQVELTAEEAHDIWHGDPDKVHWYPRMRAVIAAHIAKQHEPNKPKTVKLRMAKHINCSQVIAIAVRGNNIGAGYHWVSEEFESPPIQTDETV